MRIVGIDVGRSSAVLCCLDGLPTNISQHYKLLRREKQFHKVNCSASGVDKLLSLKPDGIVIEPTGHWYSEFWITVANQHDIDVHWIGHVDLDSQRKHFGFTNKRDEEDALSLGATYFDPQFTSENGNKRFLKYYYGEETIIARVREQFHEKKQLQKLRNSMVNQLRQRLAFEYPEAVKVAMTISRLRGFTPIIGWLAGRHETTLQENKYALSVAHQLSIQISDYTRAHAQTIYDLELRISDNQDRMLEVLKLEQFQPYMRVFDRFGFGVDNKILLLYHIYPFDKFLQVGKPLIEHEFNDKGAQLRM